MVTVFESKHFAPLQLVVLELKADKMKVQQGEVAEYEESLRHIDAYLWQRQSESVYSRKTLTYYNGTRVCLIKPNQKRFWSRMQAYDDAASIVNDIMSM